MTHEAPKEAQTHGQFDQAPNGGLDGFTRDQLLACLVHRVMCEVRLLAWGSVYGEAACKERLRQIGHLADAFHNMAETVPNPSRGLSSLQYLRSLAVDYNQKYPYSPDFVGFIDAAIEATAP